ncbi:S-DNA-T family DNA segregation ATPase FtsK/SpoIIIE [Streptosporangium becharense]|uniref:S-DNA-T family DNA segregation ATPase FtsK/SpoIIIE n=1 Tax=Streptosporangium becharense TaxID=1816182 RepID=A0A7W9IFR1_9ACTN|nr:cell division protein FtsK [Streptosporangium becharense]MBB2909149.1 S-DNA-T family DNA segregation ATPase FtsK/SpoIIIE [Streptosporangium becharense]MBB5819832.1 S-DNA-T family DNA segregation ATPase FtsK/SpoIIIE [Streptosporangium becharense]
MTDIPTETNGHRPTDPAAPLELTVLPARPPVGAEGDGPGAEVVSIETARDRRTPSPLTVPAPRPETPAGAPAPVLEGEVVRVDVLGEADRDWRAELAEKNRTRRPIVPLWLRSRTDAIETLRWAGEYAAYVAGYQLARTPLYAGRLAVRAPRGLARLVAGMVRWTFDLEGEPVRLSAVQKADPEAYLKLSRQRDSRVRLRVWVSGAALVTLLIASIIVASVPTAAQWTALAVAVAVLGVIGRPADRPLIDRAVIPTRVEKLTSDIVVRALTVLGVSGLNAKADVNFVAPITRDGPGWRADVDLPYGVTVTDVMDKRERLASALRRPLGCIWPEGDSSIHEGRLILWVGDKDLSKTIVKSPLDKAGSHDVFKGIPFGNDPRGRLVTVPIIEHNILIGSQPGQGKTASVRELAAGIVLDVTTEAWFHELKGTGDLDPYEKVCHRYVSGIDDASIGYAADSLALLRKEVMRRAAALKTLPADLCPDRKVTRAIADKRSLGLHPLVCIIDECQNLFAHAEYGDKAGEDAEFIIKLGRALGVVLILATQRPDKDSLPTGISANVSIRFCLRVAGQLENDMILGTSAYKNGIRATVFQPKVDAGTGYLVGATPMAKVVKAAYLDTPATQRIADRAHALRAAAGVLSGHAAGEQPEATAPAYDLLADIAAVLAAGEAKVWNETVVDRLADLRPEVYGPWAEQEGPARTAQLTNALKPYGIKTGQVWGTPPGGGKGANRIGIVRDDILTAITERDGKKGFGAGS